MPPVRTYSPLNQKTMRIKPEQLATQLKQELRGAYWVSGDEPLLVQEATDIIRRAALDRGFTERHSLHPEPNIDWAHLFHLTQSMGLFSQQQLIEIHLGDRRLDQNGNQTLTHILENQDPNIVLLVSSNYLRAADKKKTAYSLIQQQGATIDIPQINTAQLPHWLKQRLQQHGLTINEDALALLAERNEGNLLAAAQEVEKLALLFPNTTISLTHIQEAVGARGRYDNFDISEAILAQDPAHALRILQGLKAEGHEPPLMLWALRRDCRVLLALATGNKPQDYIHSSKLARYRQVAQRLGERSLMEAMAEIPMVDQALKGLLPGSPWQPLESLVLRLCGHPLPRQHERI